MCWQAGDTWRVVKRVVAGAVSAPIFRTHLSGGGKILSKGGLRCTLLPKEALQASPLAFHTLPRLKPLRHESKRPPREQPRDIHEDRQFILREQKNKHGGCHSHSQRKLAQPRFTSSPLCLPLCVFRSLSCLLPPPSHPPPNGTAAPTRSVHTTDSTRGGRARTVPARCDAGCRWKREAVRIPAHPVAFPSKGPR